MEFLHFEQIAGAGRVFLGFAVLALAANQIGRYFLKVQLPLISGFLFAGIVIGPFFLGLLSSDDVQNLWFVDETALAVIAFAAGSELYVKELRSRLKSVLAVTSGLVIATFVLGSWTVFILGDQIPFMRVLSPPGRLGVALLAGAILVARSPSSAIAIVNELRARGPFTQTILGVTVIMDVVVIVLFAVNSEIADALFNEMPFNIGFVTLVAGELLLSLVLGYLLSKVLAAILALAPSGWIKSFLVLAAGFGVFRFSAEISAWSHRQLPFEVLLEPLLICMIAGFLLTNRSRHRDQFHYLLQQIGPPIYVAFFTLTGAALKLDILVDVWSIALILFGVRLLGIFIGSFLGGAIAGDPVQHNRISWMAYVTQAGVGLGLAREVVVEFADIGQAFATMIIAVIVLNQLVGPPFFKWAIRRIGEAHLPGDASKFDGERDVVLFGLNARSMALAQQLRVHDWQVKIATVMPPDSDLNQEKLQIHYLADWTVSELKKLDLDRAESIVCLTNEDDQNYRICEQAYETFGIKNMVVQLRNRENRPRFRELGVLIVEPETALVTLMEQMVRAPAGASLLMGMEEGHDIIDVELRNPNLDGFLLRDLRLPVEVIILSIHRNDEILLTRGNTRLHAGDKITMSGPMKRLEEVALRFESG